MGQLSPAVDRIYPRPTTADMQNMALDMGLGMIEELHRAYGHPVTFVPELLDRRERELRFKLIQEEVDELREALRLGDIVKVADACWDLCVVIFGAMIAFGIPSEGFGSVHRSNMSKLGEDGKPIKREDGKVLKGPNYRPADCRTPLAKRGAKFADPPITDSALLNGHKPIIARLLHATDTSLEDFDNASSAVSDYANYIRGLVKELAAILPE